MFIIFFVICITLAFHSVSFDGYMLMQKGVNDFKQYYEHSTSFEVKTCSHFNVV